MRTSTRCRHDKWRTLLAGGFKAFLTLFLLSFFTIGSVAQNNTPCNAHRWFAGDGWRFNTTTNQWEAVTLASPNLQPKGIVRCASSAETESGLQEFAGPYHASDFPILQSSFNNCFDQETETRTATVNAPTEGEDIVWFNFDIRPLAGTYQFQIVTNESVGWALYYVDTANAQPTTATGSTYPPTATGISGNCQTLVYADCGTSGNGWSTITVPSFKKPTNYYLAMWMNSTTATEFPSSMNLVYKSRFGCGGATCTLEFLQKTFTCTENGYQVCGLFGGSAGRWIVQDNAAVKATSYTITTYKANGTDPGEVVSTQTVSSLDGTQTVTLGTVPDGAVFARVCATYASGQPYNIMLVPDGTFSGGSNYVTCTDGSGFSGTDAPTNPTVEGTATPSTIVLSTGNSSALSAVASGGTGPYTYVWTELTPDAFSTLTNGANGSATFTIDSYPNPLPTNYDFQVEVTDAIGCKATDVVQVIPDGSLEPCGIYGPPSACEGTTGLVYTYGDAGTQTPFTLNTTNFAYKWTITGNGTITSEDDNTGTVTVNTNGDGSFTLTMTIDNITGILPDRTCQIQVTVNPTPATPTLDVVPPTCTSANGTVTVTAPLDGEGIDYEYRNNGGDWTDNTVFTVAAGATYSIEARNKATGCISAAMGGTMAEQPQTPGAPSAEGNSRCNEGTVELTASGCEGGTLLWYDVAEGGTSIGSGSPFTTPSISTTTTFYVSCKVGDCEGPRTAVVASVTLLAGVQATPMGTTCGQNNGSITITAPVGEGIMYSLNGGTPQSDVTFSNLAPGTYSITATLGVCTSSGTATVEGSTTLAGVQATPMGTTCGQNNGSITITAPVGEGIMYSLNGGTPQSDVTFSNLAPGTYSITATLGVCTSSGTATVEGSTTLAGVQATPMGTTCGQNNGSITITAPVGEGIMYSLNGGTPQSDVTFSNLAPGTYSITATLGVCTSSGTATVEGSTTLAGVQATPMGTTCGQNNGSITITAPVGEGIMYSLNGGTPQSDVTFSNLAPGTYSITATLGVCTSSGTATVEGSTTLAGVQATPMGTTCGQNNGSITITAPVGEGIMYSLNGGTPQSDVTFSNLAPGTYSITATLGVCTSSGTATVEGSTTLAGVQATPMGTTCGQNNGSITITAPVGEGIMYSLNGGTPQSDVTFSNLAPGTYSITATLGVCTSSGTATVEGSTTLAGVQATPMGTTCGQNNGSITITSPVGEGIMYSLNGGTPQSDVTFSNLAPGTYSITATLGVCTSSGTATVEGSTTLAGVQATPMGTTCGQNNGSITITSPVGEGIMYSLNGGTPQSDVTFSNLAPGTYSITATLGVCTSSGTATVEGSTTLAGVQATPMGTTCGQNNGSITITSPVGEGIMYSLNGGTPQSDVTFSNLAPGTYSITATLGVCTSSGTATVDGSEPCNVSHCSYTQGFWGNKNGLKLMQDQDLLATPIVIGRSGQSVTIPAGSEVHLNKMMPGGGTPGALLPGDYTLAPGNPFKSAYLTKQGRIGNNLLSQTIALTLNTRVDASLLDVAIQSGCLVTGNGSFEINANVANYLTNNGTTTATVADLLRLANDVLGGKNEAGDPRIPGQPGDNGINVPSYSDVTSAIDAINNAFDECTNFIGYQSCDLVTSVTARTVENTTANAIVVNTYPNPFTDVVKFTIESKVSGQAQLEIVNMTGQRIATVYNGYIRAGHSQVVEYRVPSIARTNLIYVLKINDKQATGKLLNARR